MPVYLEQITEEDYPAFASLDRDFSAPYADWLRDFQRRVAHYGSEPNHRIVYVQAAPGEFSEYCLSHGLPCNKSSLGRFVMEKGRRAR
jgi:hypothetical protein